MKRARVTRHEYFEDLKSLMKALEDTADICDCFVENVNYPPFRLSDWLARIPAGIATRHIKSVTGSPPSASIVLNKSNFTRSSTLQAAYAITSSLNSLPTPSVPSAPLLAVFSESVD
jgi:hypothetical protein